MKTYNATKNELQQNFVQQNAVSSFPEGRSFQSRSNEDNNLVCCYKFQDKLQEESDDTLKWSAVENQSTERQIRRERSSQVRWFSFTSTLQMTALDKLISSVFLEDKCATVVTQETIENQ